MDSKNKSTEQELLSSEGVKIFACEVARDFMQLPLQIVKLPFLAAQKAAEGVGYAVNSSKGILGSNNGNEENVDDHMNGAIKAPELPSKYVPLERKESQRGDVSVSPEAQNSEAQEKIGIDFLRAVEEILMSIELDSVKYNVNMIFQDYVIFLLVTIMTTVSTYLNWDDIQIPFHVSALWLIASFYVGIVVCRTEPILKKIQVTEEQIIEASSNKRSEAMTSQVMRSIIERISMFPTRREGVLLTEELPAGFFTCLLNEISEPEISQKLMNRLLRASSHTKTPDGMGIIPVFKYRGMDVLLSDSPENPIHKNVYLNKCGLRRVPTFVLNVILSWANIALYYEMPDWVKDFNNIVIEEKDADDVKVLKKFLQGDVEYRRLRMQFLPYLVDGPYAVKLIAPERKELIGRATLMPPFTWYTENESTDEFGHTRCAVIEASVDVTASYLSRTATNILRSYLGSLSLDVAFVIDQPEFQKEFEPSCVIGLCQLNHIDVTKCAVLPRNDDTTMRHATLFASQLKL